MCINCLSVPTFKFKHLKSSLYPVWFFYEFSKKKSLAIKQVNKYRVISSLTMQTAFWNVIYKVGFIVFCLARHISVNNSLIWSILIGQIWYVFTTYAGKRVVIVCAIQYYDQTKKVLHFWDTLYNVLLWSYRNHHL